MSWSVVRVPVWIGVGLSASHTSAPVWWSIVISAAALEGVLAWRRTRPGTPR